MNRLTDNDRNFGPFTFAQWKRSFRVEFNTGDEDERDRCRNNFLIVAFGWALRIMLPNLVPPLRVKHEAKSWDAETVKRMGRDWYYQTFERVFGLSLSDMGGGYDFLQVHYGARTHDSSTDRVWSAHLPWKQWDCVRHSLYAPDGAHFYTEPHWKERRKTNARACWEMSDQCPACHFGFEDYDGDMIVATCSIEEREWHKGDGWFTWLKYFSRPKIRRSLDIKFSAEVGPGKGSWKGGTLGHGIEMLPNETPAQAFRRYCEMEHDARQGRKYRIRFIGPCGPPTKRETVAV